MIATTTLAPHDEMPTGRAVVVLRRFDEDNPSKAVVQIVLTAASRGRPEQSTHPRRPDGSPMPLDEAIAAARKVAESEGLNRVFVLDRLAGEREKAILTHGGDHSVGMARLQDTDEEDGVRGSNMRDIAHRTPT